MPIYTYKATDEQGKAVKGQLDATSEAAARYELARLRLVPASMREKKSILQFEISPQRVKPVDVMNASRQLSAFVRAGIPILDALQIIGEEVENKRFKGILDDIRVRVQGGEPLAVAVNAHTDVFPEYFVGILRAAELTGHLDDALDQLADYIDRDLEAKRKIKSAITYPTVVVGFAIVTVIVLSAWVLPRFKTFFTSLDAELPLSTRMLLGITDFLTGWWWLLLGLIVVGVLGLVAVLRTEGGRGVRDRVLLRLPGLGTVVRFAIIERFCRMLASMVKAGVPLPDAMTVATASTNNRVFQKGLTGARDAMVRGEGLARPIAETGLFPGSANQMLRVGENTGTLDTQLSGAAHYFERELGYRIKKFTDMFEPAIILVVGLVVGFVAVALVQAMYGVFNQVQ